MHIRSGQASWHTVLCSATETLALKTDNFLESEALGSERPRIRTKNGYVFLIHVYDFV